jgi:hypothetical protein
MDDNEERRHMEAQDAEYRKAEKKLAAGIREYLWDMVRISGSPEWETNPDFILLAVLRVTLQYVCYQNYDPSILPDDNVPLTVADEVAQSRISELAQELDELGCQ